MKLYLVDDPQARRWSPFAETRPVGELRFGAMLLRERVERCWNVPCEAHMVAGGPGPSLAGLDEPGMPRVLDAGAPEEPVEGGALFWLSRAAPDLANARVALPADRAVVLGMGGRYVGLWLPASSNPIELMEALGGAELGDALPELPEADALEVPGILLEWPWSLVEANAAALGADLAALYPDAGPPEYPGVHAIGDHPVSLEPTAEVGPGVILDARAGPIRLDAGVVVEGPARLTGPLHLGPGSVVFGGHLSRVSAGPVCKLRGEIDTAILVGYDNKAHDGYLGHALLGRWVNLGAMTTNSDLKNDYGPVRVELAGEVVDTGLMKVGVFLGDHVKTGIGTVLNTGSVVGAGSNVFGGGMPPKALPPFSWAGGGGVAVYRWDKFLQVARTVVARRRQPWTPGVERALRALWDATHGESD